MEILNFFFNLVEAKFQIFILILSRLSGLFLDAPVLSNRNIPALVKIGFLMFLSFILINVIDVGEVKLLTGNLLLFAIFREILIGLIIGFVCRLMFVSLQIAGQLIDYQMGFAFVNILDPESRIQIPIIGQFLFIFAILVFFLINGHHWMINALVKSFEKIPLGRLEFYTITIKQINAFFAELFVIAFKISAPLIITLFTVDTVYGVLARTIPQANILVIGFPLKIGLGLLVIFISLPIFLMAIKRMLVSLFFNLNLLLR